jgi:hypothetical protein
VGDAPPRYRLGPLERRGFVAGLRGGQVACLGGGLAGAVAVDRVLSPATGLVAALLVAAAGLAAATWPVRGRTVEEWLPTAAHAAALRLGRRTRFRSGLPALGHRAPGAVGEPSGSSPTLGPAPEVRAPLLRGRPLRVAARRAPLVPPPLRGCALDSAVLEGSTARIGVVEDRREGTLTAVVALGLPGFCLRASEDQHAQVGAWSAVLAGLAREGSPVHRLQWVERVLPCAGSRATSADDAPPDRCLDEGGVPGAACSWPARLDGDRGGADDRLRRSYERLVASVLETSERHQVLLAVAVRAGRGARSRSDASLGTLGHVVRSLEDDLRAAGLPVAGALSPRALACCLRLAVERAGGAASGPGFGPETAEAPVPWPWPLSFEARWSSVRTEGTWHATYWVAEWPRVAVRPDFLAPLVLHAGVRRTVSVVMEPLPPGRAAREAERARTEDLADAELRERGGFLATARRRREQESLALRELELADGHAPYRFSGYVTVTADRREELEPACARVEQASGQAGLELRRLHGDQDRAWCCTLPLGRGLS